MDSAVLPVFVSCTGTAALLVPTFCSPKFTPSGESLTTVPAPERATVCGLPVALSVTESSPDAGPLAVGLNETWIWQSVSTGKLEGQLLLWLKGAAAEIFETVTATEPVLVKVAV